MSPPWGHPWAGPAQAEVSCSPSAHSALHTVLLPPIDPSTVPVSPPASQMRKLGLRQGRELPQLGKGGAGQGSDCDPSISDCSFSGRHASPCLMPWHPLRGIRLSSQPGPVGLGTPAGPWTRLSEAAVPNASVCHWRVGVTREHLTRSPEPTPMGTAHWGLDRQSLWPGCLRSLGLAGATARGVSLSTARQVYICAPVHVQCTHV